MSCQQERSEAAKINAQPDSTYGSVASNETDARLQSIIRSYQLSERSIFSQEDSADPVKPLSFEFSWKILAVSIINVLKFAWLFHVRIILTSLAAFRILLLSFLCREVSIDLT